MHVHPASAPTIQPAILASAPRCGARTRAGHPCRSPAVKGNARCRMHGGSGSGAPRGNRNALKHGWYSGRVRAIVRYLRATRPENFARRVAAFAAEGVMERPPTVTAVLSAPALRKKENKKFEQQPHAPGIFANGSQQEPPPDAAIDEAAPSPPEIPASAARTRWRRAGQGANPLSKENLARPQTSLICVTASAGPCGTHGILA